MNNHISFIMSGEITINSGSAWLTTLDGTRFKLKKIPTFEENHYTGNVIPNTNSDGSIATLKLISLATTETEIDVCRIKGKLLQVSSRNNTLIFSVEGESNKEIKITLKKEISSSMEVGEVWDLVVVRKGKYLSLTDATLSSNPDTTPLASSLYSQEIKALSVLQQEIGENDYQLNNFKKREGHCTYDFTDGNETIGRIIIYDQGMTKVLIFPTKNNTQNSEISELNEKFYLRILGKKDQNSCQFFLEEYEIIIDCCVDEKGNFPDLDYIENPDLLIITHSHNIGGLPKFCSRYPSAKIISSPLTLEMAYGLSWIDNDTEVIEALSRIETIPIGETQEIFPKLEIKLINAGHIGGNVCVFLKYYQRSLLYTHHFHTANGRLNEGIRLSDLEKTDIVICESTYGLAIHPSRKTQENNLVKDITNQLNSNKYIIIFAGINTGLEILLMLLTGIMLKQKNIDLYLDSSIYKNLQIILNNKKFLLDSFKNFLTEQKAIFSSRVYQISHLKETTTKVKVIITNENQIINNNLTPEISELLDNSVCFIQEFSEFNNTIIPAIIPSNIPVIRYNISNHADKIGLGQIISKTSPLQIILVSSLKEEIEDLQKKYDNLYSLSVGELVKYSKKQKLILPSLNEIDLEAGIEKIADNTFLLTIPPELKNDPRWLNLIRKKTLSLIWDKEDLILSLAKDSIDLSKDCCNTCSFYKYGICTNDNSPLYSLKVEASGICSQYSRR